MYIYDYKYLGTSNIFLDTVQVYTVLGQFLLMSIFLPPPSGMGWLLLVVDLVSPFFSFLFYFKMNKYILPLTLSLPERPKRAFIIVLCLMLDDFTR